MNRLRPLEVSFVGRVRDHEHGDEERDAHDDGAQKRKEARFAVEKVPEKIDREREPEPEDVFGRKMLPEFRHDQSSSASWTPKAFETSWIVQAVTAMAMRVERTSVTEMPTPSASKRAT